MEKYVVEKTEKKKKPVPRSECILLFTGEDGVTREVNVEEL